MPEAPYSLLAELENVRHMAHPPVDQWQPDVVRDIDMRIARDGTWYHEGSPIERLRLVRLFSTILRRESDDEYYLVTPVEKFRIQVEDVPFQAILMDVVGRGRDQVLKFTTNVADEVIADAAHPVRLAVNARTGEPSPYVLIRNGMEALISRNVYYQLSELIVSESIGGEDWLGVWSSGEFFQFIPDDDND